MKKDAKVRVMSLRLNDDLAKQIEAAAAREQRPTANLIRLCIADGLKARAERAHAA